MNLMKEVLYQLRCNVSSDKSLEILVLRIDPVACCVSAATTRMNCAFDVQHVRQLMISKNISRQQGFTSSAASSLGMCRLLRCTSSERFNPASSHPTPNDANTRPPCSCIKTAVCGRQLCWDAGKRWSLLVRATMNGSKPSRDDVQTGHLHPSASEIAAEQFAPQFHSCMHRSSKSSGTVKKWFEIERDKGWWM